MKQKILNSTRALFGRSKSSTRRRSKARNFARRALESIKSSSRRVLPLGILWDPALLDRLQSPLTRRLE